MKRDYSHLKDYLDQLPKNESETFLPISEIEQIIHKELPRAARSGKSWWTSESNAHVKLWASAGWEVVDIVEKGVHFKRKSLPLNQTKGLFLTFILAWILSYIINTVVDIEYKPFPCMTPLSKISILTMVIWLLLLVFSPEITSINVWGISFTHKNYLGVLKSLKLQVQVALALGTLFIVTSAIWLGNISWSPLNLHEELPTIEKFTLNVDGAVIEARPEDTVEIRQDSSVAIKVYTDKSVYCRWFSFEKSAITNPDSCSTQYFPAANIVNDLLSLETKSTCSEYETHSNIKLIVEP